VRDLALPRLWKVFVVLGLWIQGCGGTGSRSDGVFTLQSESAFAEFGYAPAPPQHVFDSARIEVRLKPRDLPGTDTLRFELLPAENGWSRAETATLVKDSQGWYRGALWMCPTVPGQFVTSWQTDPFTGFTYYLAARYDSLGQLLDWDDNPKMGYPNHPLLVRDTMEVVYRLWPQVWARRVHFEKRTDVPREFYLITESFYRSRGVSGRHFEYSANLVPSPDFPLRTRQWEEPGWVVDTLSVWVRDTLVAWVAWSYDEFVDNWEKNTTLFRDWQYKRQPELYFKTDFAAHLSQVWTVQPEGQYVAAKMYADTSQPAFDSLKRAFMYGPVPAAP
jgi:hypothetical protein